MVEKVIIMGAAGRDFHNFNVYFKDNPRYEVVAFTAAQIPTIEGRYYPSELAGKIYPEGIEIHPEDQLAALIREHQVDLVAFSYSDVPHVEVMHKASIAMAEGADFIVWDGGNNDTPFFCPDIHIVLFDPHRAGHELLYYPGETNMIMSDIAIINKVDTASLAQV